MGITVPAMRHAGSGNVDNWIKQNTIKEDGSDVENIPFKETNYYVRKILKDYRIYKQLYEQEGQKVEIFIFSNQMCLKKE